MAMSGEKKQELRLYAWVRANEKLIDALMKNPEVLEKAKRLVGLR